MQNVLTVIVCVLICTKCCKAANNILMKALDKAELTYDIRTSSTKFAHSRSLHTVNDTTATKSATPEKSETCFGGRRRTVRDVSFKDLRPNNEKSTNQNVTYDIQHLTDMCPYADICGRKGREIPSKLGGSCCLPCSCESTCTIIGNCCDKRAINTTMCHVAQAAGSTTGTKYASAYFMVDRCLKDSTKPNCSAETVAPWGTLYPVYDFSSNLIFYNRYCAECSAAQNYVQWEPKIVCRLSEINTGLYRNVLRGNSDIFCTLVFTPPNGVDLIKHVCSNELISACNVSGQWTEYNAELENACLRWSSPMVHRRGYLSFANVYCYLCNNGIYNPENFCAELQPEKDLIASSVPLAITIDYLKITADADKLLATDVEPMRNEKCSDRMVKHISKPECRAVLCPSGYIRIGMGCETFIDKFMMHAYYVQLQMTPTSDDLLPLEYLTTLTDKQLSVPGTWFNAQGAPLDYFEIIVDDRNTTFVEKMLVRVGKSKSPLIFDKEIEAIKKAMTKLWTVNLKGHAFRFWVDFDKYARFDRRRPRYSIISSLTNELIFEGEPTEIHYRRVVRPRQEREKIFPLTLKKTNFCDRVQLFRSEWVEGFQEIRLNLSTLLQSQKIIGDSEFDIHLNDMGQPTVEICVADFNPDYDYLKEYTNGALSLQISLCSLHVLLDMVLSFD